MKTIELPDLGEETPEQSCNELVTLIESLQGEFKTILVWRARVENALSGCKAGAATQAKPNDKGK